MIFGTVVLLSNEHTHIVNYNFLTSGKPEIQNLTIWILINGENFHSCAMTFTLIRLCLMSKPSELFSYTTIC